MRVAQFIDLSLSEKQALTKLSNSRRSSLRLVERAKIVLLAGEGLENQQIGKELGITREKPSRWRMRYAEKGLLGIEKDAPRSGRRPRIADTTTEEVIRKTLNEKPANATRWSRSRMAKVTGLSDSTIGRIWKRKGLKPHLIKGFKLSNDKNFVEKLEDIVGLCMSPPEHAVVLSCDEKSQIQAPKGKGLGETQ
jgi:transposase